MFLKLNNYTGSTIAGDFTWETWAYDTGGTGNGTLLGWRTGSWTGFIVQRNNSNNLVVSINNGTNITQTSGTYLTNQWNHVALVRSGTTVTFDLATIFPRLTFTNRGLSVTLQLVAVPTYTITSSAFVVLGRTGNSNVWSNAILANININGVAVNSVSASGTVITVVYSTQISGTAYINVANIG